MRIAVYTDYPYHLAKGELYAERAFALFIASLAPHFSRTLVAGRLVPGSDRSNYAVGRHVEFVALPHYEALTSLGEVRRSAAGSLARFWSALGEVDCVWLLGPNPFAVAFAMLAAIRRKRVVLGVRQDYRAYVRARHPGRRGVRALAAILDGLFRALARGRSTVVVGPRLGDQYRRSRALLEIAVSLVSAEDVVAPSVALERSYEGELTILSVGRLEEEKNPLLLADVLARLRARDPRWRLVVCGEGEMRAELQERLDRLGVADGAELRGYVPFGRELMDLYRRSHALLHVSWTEGLPQVLLEAFAAGLPTVATDVGGVGAVGDAARLISPGDPDAAASALEAIASEADLRERLVHAGHGYVSSRTLERESGRVAEFLSAAS